MESNTDNAALSSRPENPEGPENPEKPENPSKRKALAALRLCLRPTVPRGTPLAKMTEHELTRAAKRIRLIEATSADEDATPIQWMDLPEDLVFTIIERVVASTRSQPDVILNLIATSNFFRNVFKSNESLSMWKDVWQAVLDTRPHVCNNIPDFAESPEAFHRVVALTSSIGCAKCRAPRIRKITWGFNARLCQTCLKDSTISGYTLEKYGIQKTDFASLRHIEKIMYSPYFYNNGEYVVRLYLRKDVDQLVGRLFGDDSLKAFENRKQNELQTALNNRNRVCLVSLGKGMYQCASCFSPRPFQTHFAAMNHCRDKHPDHTVIFSYSSY